MKPLFTILILGMFFSTNAFATADVKETNKSNIVSVELFEQELNTDNRRPLAIIRRFNPDVLVRSNGKAEWANATVTQPLFNADSLVTNDSGFAMIQFMDNSIVRMRPNSLLVVGGESRTRESTVTRLTMEAGEIFVSVTGLGQSTEVVTPSAVAAVRGTNFAVLLKGEGNRGRSDSDNDETKSNGDLDSDNDGLFDLIDGIQPPDLEPDLDSDNDGLFDLIDGIQPPDSEPDLDSDNDGIPDIADFFKNGNNSTTTIIGFDGEVLVTPKNGEGSYSIFGGNVITIDEDGNVTESTLSEEELADLLRGYLAEGPQTRTRTLELRFVNDAGEVEVITIEYEEPIENE